MHQTRQMNTRAVCGCVEVCRCVWVCAHITQQQRHKNSNYIKYGNSSNSNKSCNSDDIARKLKCILQVARSQAEAHHGKVMCVVTLWGSGTGRGRWEWCCWWWCDWGGFVGDDKLQPFCKSLVECVGNAFTNRISASNLCFLHSPSPICPLPFVHVQWEIQFPKRRSVKNQKFLHTPESQQQLA